MLAELSIQNFALIDRLRIPFGRGVNVLTGETGAGKSIVIDALGLLRGGRADAETVRGGERTAVIEGRFDLRGWPAIAGRLDELGYGPEDGEVILGREVSTEGRGRAYVNGRPVTIATLREIGERLLEIHGQHEGQRLLQPPVHADLLDAFAGDDALEARAEVGRLVAEVRRLRAEREALLADERERARTIDLLRFQVQELDAARLRAGEEVELEAEHGRLAHADRLQAAALAAYEGLYDREGAAVEELGRAAARLREVAALDPGLAPLAARLAALADDLADAAHEVHAYAERVEHDPRRLADVETRLALLAGLRRKYGETAGEMLRYRERIAADLARLERSDERAEEIAQEIVRAEAALGAAAARLGEARARASRDLERRVLKELADLDLARAAFAVSLGTREADDGVPVAGRRLAVGPRGAEDVEFLLAANPGEPLRPLARIASGGEASRIMLAIRGILADADAVPALVFDEIDVGIGGRAAQIVGEKLASLGERRQVLCVTHLAQIAAQADEHFAVSKHAAGDRTRTRVERLDAEGRVQELARMLAGKRATELAVGHAREMLGQAQRARRGRRPART